jgi:4-amino-4-deoxy-L-arabinose transferase-like glycosyltransferase
MSELSARAPWWRDPPALIVGLLTLALHGALAGRYDVFRDELYFIVCGRHPQFGYVDQPPLVPLLAAGTYALGAHAWLLRLPAVLAAGALVWLVVAFVRLLGGRDGAAWTAAVVAMVAPMFLGITATLNTTTFELVAWTAVAYAIARAVVREDRTAPIWGGVVAGFALEAKYALVTWLVALACGLLLTPQRRLFARRELWLGLGLAAVIAAPSLVWQAGHHWPFAELMAAARNKNSNTPPLAFIVNQIFVMNPLLAPLWIAGIVTPFVWRDLARVRCLALAFVVQYVLTIATHGKDYYLAAAYPTAFVLGAIAFERVVRWVPVRAAYLVLATALSAVVAPIALPILAPATLQVYAQRLHLIPQPQEKLATHLRLPQVFSDELGWHDFVRQVAAAYDALPPVTRAQTAILAGDYGQAGAIDVYGFAYGLPPALSGHNQYYLWALRGQNPRNIIDITWDPPASDARYCDHVRVLGHPFSPFAMPYENRTTFVFCEGLHPSLAALWHLTKNYN